MTTDLNLITDPLVNGLVVEASAGTVRLTRLPHLLPEN